MIAALAALLLCASAADGHRLRHREVTVSVEGRATNGYHFQMYATNEQGPGKSAVIELDREGASAIYIARHPRRVRRHRVSADFGDLGHVSLRFHVREAARPHVHCFHEDLRFGRFRGAIRFDGESGYSRVRARRPFGAVEVQGIEPCSSDVLPAPPETSSAQDAPGSVLSSCGESGTGLFAAERHPGSPSDFLASSMKHTDGLLVFRSIFLEGAARNLKLSPDRSTGVVRPPEPFLGRARLADGRLTGNLRVALPGAGLVRLTPGNAAAYPLNQFKPPECFPFAILDESGSTAAEHVARVLGS